MSRETGPRLPVMRRMRAASGKAVERFARGQGAEDARTNSLVQELAVTKPDDVSGNAVDPGAHGSGLAGQT